jgi:hypothetical protein
MKKKFSHFQLPTQIQSKNLWDKCLFVFDTNALLNLYRYSPTARKDFLKILKSIEDRIWLPYQIGYEFYKNRIKTLNDEISQYDKFVKELQEIETMLNKLGGLINSKKSHPHINSKFVDDIKKIINKAKSNISSEKKKFEKFKQKDTVVSCLEKLFKNKVGENYTSQELKKIIIEGEFRYRNEIPPGYEDELSKDKSGLSKYGDLIIWFQIIDKAKEFKKPIVFITDDVTGDWWKLLGKGKIECPRPELIEEIGNECKVSFYMYHSDKFMELSRKYLKQNINNQSIIEAKETRENVKKHDIEKLLPMINALHFPQEQSDLEKFFKTFQEDVTRLNNVWNIPISKIIDFQKFDFNNSRMVELAKSIADNITNFNKFNISNPNFANLVGNLNKTIATKTEKDEIKDNSEKIN